MEKQERQRTKDIGSDFIESSNGVLSVLWQVTTVLLQVINVLGELSLQYVVVPLDGVDEVAEVTLEGASESGDNLFIVNQL